MYLGNRLYDDPNLKLNTKMLLDEYNKLGNQSGFLKNEKVQIVRMDGIYRYINHAGRNEVWKFKTEQELRTFFRRKDF